MLVSLSSLCYVLLNLLDKIGDSDAHTMIAGRRINPMIQPDFPERGDIPHLSDQEAEAALAIVRLLVAQDQAAVYTRPYTSEGERPQWNVRDMTSGKGRRVELEPWAMDVLSPSAAGVEL
jgi:hypothetical protein